MHSLKTKIVNLQHNILSFTLNLLHFRQCSTHYAKDCSQVIFRPIILKTLPSNEKAEYGGPCHSLPLEKCKKIKKCHRTPETRYNPTINPRSPLISFEIRFVISQFSPWSIFVNFPLPRCKPAKRMECGLDNILVPKKVLTKPPKHLLSKHL